MMEEGLYEPIYVYEVYLQTGELVQKYASTRQPPSAGKKLILIVDEAYKRFTVHEINTAKHENGYEYYILKVSADEKI